MRRIVLTVFLIGGPALAQATPVTQFQEVGGFDEEAPRKDFSDVVSDKIVSAMVREHQGILVAHMRQQINSMSELLKLPRTTREKLMLAAKGAAKQQAADQRATFAEFVRESVTGNTFSVNDIPIRTDKEAPDNKQLTADARPDCAIGIVVNTGQLLMTTKEKNGVRGLSGHDGGLTELWEQAIWTTALESLTTPEQRKEYSEHETTLLRKHVGDLITAMFAYELRLTETDRAKLHQWVIEQMQGVPKTSLVGGRRLVISNATSRFKLTSLEQSFGPDLARLLRMKMIASNRAW